MYELFTTAELTALQGVLFEGTERAFWAADLKRDNQDWLAHYGPMHQEVANLFIEAGTELARRFDEQLEAA